MNESIERIALNPAGPRSVRGSVFAAVVVSIILGGVAGTYADTHIRCAADARGQGVCSVEEDAWFVRRDLDLDVRALESASVHVRYGAKNSVRYLLMVRTRGGEDVLINERSTPSLVQAERVAQQLNTFLQGRGERSVHLMLPRGPILLTSGVMAALLAVMMLLTFNTLGRLTIHRGARKVVVQRYRMVSRTVPMDGIRGVQLEVSRWGGVQLALELITGESMVLCRTGDRYLHALQDVAERIRVALGLAEPMAPPLRSTTPPGVVARQPDAHAADPALHCPRCHPRQALVPGRTALHDQHCRRCHGLFLQREDTDQLVVRDLGLTPQMIKELSRHFGGAQLPCPSCSRKMTVLRLKGHVVDLCEGCGGMWLDRGELGGVSGGRYSDLEPVRVPMPTPAGAVASGALDSVEVVRAPRWLQPGALNHGPGAVMGALGLVMTTLGLGFLSLAYGTGVAGAAFFGLLFIAGLVLTSRVRLRISTGGELHSELLLLGWPMFSRAQPVQGARGISITGRSWRTAAGTRSEYALWLEGGGQRRLLDVTGVHEIARARAESMARVLGLPVRSEA